MDIPLDPGEIYTTPKKVLHEEIVSEGPQDIEPAKQVRFDLTVRINANSWESALILKERVQGKFVRESGIEESLIPTKKRRVERLEFDVHGALIPGGRTLETAKLHHVQFSAHKNIVRLPLVPEGNPLKEPGKIHTTISEKIKVLLRKKNELHRSFFNFVTFYVCYCFGHIISQSQPISL